MRKVRRQRKSSSQLLALECQFDRLFESMQTSRSKRAVKAALKASPEELGRAALEAGRKQGEAMATWEARLDMLGPLASFPALLAALEAAPGFGPAVYFLRGFLAGREIGVVDRPDEIGAVRQKGSK